MHVLGDDLWSKVNDGQLLLRLTIDLFAVFVLAIALYFHRYRRRDVVVTLVTFNVGLFAVLTVITAEPVSAGVGFGLFAVLSIIRLRSEAVSNVELGYFFMALAIGLVNGFSHDVGVVLIGLNVLILITMFLVDHPALHTTIRRRTVLLADIETDSDAIKSRLAAEYGLSIVSVSISEIDYVRETTRVVLRYVADPVRDPVTEPMIGGSS